MAYSLVVGQLVVDNPHADGWFNTYTDDGAFYCGRDWEALERRDDVKGFSPDVAGQYGWEYANTFEYIDKLACIAPMGTKGTLDSDGKEVLPDMNPGDWRFLAGAPHFAPMWKLSSKSAYLKQRVLWFYDSRPNLYPNGVYPDGVFGQAISQASYTPNLQFYIWRNGRHPDETEPPLVYIGFYGDGNEQYQIHLPGKEAQTGKIHKEMTGEEKRQYSKALLLGRKGGTPTWTVIDTQGAGAAPTIGKLTAQASFQSVRIETLQNALLIRMGDGEPWIVSGPWHDAYGQEVQTINLAAGKIEVGFIGHAGSFAMYPLNYPTSVTIYPRRSWWMPYPPWANRLDSIGFNVLGHIPSGTGITVEQPHRHRYDDGSDDDDHEVASWPNCTFTGTGYNRAQLFAVQEYRTGKRNDGVSAPVTTRNSSNFRLVSMSGNIGEDYKGSTLTATAEADPGVALATIAADSKVKAQVNTTNGDTHLNYDSGGYFSTQFVGYLTAPSKEKPPGPSGNMTAEITAADLIEARLRTMQMGYQCSFEGTERDGVGWTVGGAFKYLLNAAGVPDSCIYIAPSITNLQLPYSTLPGKRLLKFAPDTDFAQALDEIVGSVGIPSTTRPGYWRGLQWGVNPVGTFIPNLLDTGWPRTPADPLDRNRVVFLLPAYEHRPTLYDYTLDTFTTTPEDLIANFRAERSVDDFCNLLVAMQGQGADADSKVFFDERSWSDDSYARFIGRLKMRFETFSDGGPSYYGAAGSRASLRGRAEELWERIARWHWLISWTMDDCPWLLPQDEVRVVPGALATGLEVPSGAIFEIVSKSWSADAAGRYSQTLQAVRVE